MAAPYVTRFSELRRMLPMRARLRSLVRDTAVFLLSLKSRVSLSSNWIRLPLYHHVLDDEVEHFDRHLRYMRNFGEFISLDDAVGILAERQRIGGRYFCVTFDDGLKCCLTNALPVLLKHSCPAAFFIPTDYVGCTMATDADALERFYSRCYSLPMETLDWAGCRVMLEHGMTIGSHTCSHVNLTDLSQEEVRDQLSRSKQVIESKLGSPCRHFACPWGAPGRNFRSDEDPLIAKEVGYHSFLTTSRGAVLEGSDPYFLPRENLLAGWPNFQLKYFFSRN